MEVRPRAGGSATRGGGRAPTASPFQPAGLVSVFPGGGGEEGEVEEQSGGRGGGRGKLFSRVHPRVQEGLLSRAGGLAGRALKALTWPHHRTEPAQAWASAARAAARDPDTARVQVRLRPETDCPPPAVLPVLKTCKTSALPDDRICVSFTLRKVRFSDGLGQPGGLPPPARKGILRRSLLGDQARRRRKRKKRDIWEKGKLSEMSGEAG